jgi:site-specific DNA recombinase
VVVEECEAAIVRQIFAWVGVEGLRLRSVARRLEQRGIKSRGGKHWTTSTLGGVLHNRVYVGCAHHQKYESIEPARPHYRLRYRRRRKTSSRRRPEQEWIGVRVPAIVDQALFDKAQQRLLANRQQTAGQAKHPYLLRGLLFCGACGLKMWGFSGSADKIHRYWYYSCHAQDRFTARYGHPCPNRPVRADDDVEQAVWEDLARWLQEPEQLATQLEAQRDKVRTVLEAYATEQRRLAREMRSLTQAIERLVDAYQAGAIPLEELRARRERLEESKRQCQERIAQAEQEHQQAHAQQHVVDELRQLKERLHRGLERCTWEDRRAIVELLVEKVEVAEPKLVVHYIVPLGRGSGSPPAPPTATAGPAAGETGGPSSDSSQPCPRHLFYEDAAARGQRCGAPREHASDFVRRGEHPRAHGHVGQDGLDEVRGRAAHSPAVAARAGAAALAGVGDEDLLSARPAHDPDEAPG